MGLANLQNEYQISYYTFFCFFVWRSCSNYFIWWILFWNATFRSQKNFKKNQKKLTNISFGPKTVYAVRKKSLVNEDGVLISINLWSKNNLTLQKAEKYLLESKIYFESKNYKTVYAQENWSKPLLVKRNLPCIRFIDPERQILVEVDPRGQGSIYNIFVTYYNYDWFLKKARGEK